MKRVKRRNLGNFTAKNGEKFAFFGVFVDGGASGVFCEPFSKNWSVDFIGFRGDYKRTQKFEMIFRSCEKWFRTDIFVLVKNGF